MIHKITVLVDGHAADTLILYFPFEEGTWPYTDDASATMKVAARAGVEYAKKHFPDVPINVIKMRKFT